MIRLVSVPWQQKQQPEGLAILACSKEHIANAHSFCHAWSYACIINVMFMKYDFLSKHNLQTEGLVCVGTEGGEGRRSLFCF